MAENKMFCFQCQETAKGTGCTIKGVCGKEATTSKWQDLLLSVVRGIGTIQHSIGKEPPPALYQRCVRDGYSHHQSEQRKLHLSLS